MVLCLVRDLKLDWPVVQVCHQLSFLFDVRRTRYDCSGSNSIKYSKIIDINSIRHSFINKTGNKYAKLIWSSQFYNKINKTHRFSDATPTCRLQRNFESLQWSAAALHWSASKFRCWWTPNLVFKDTAFLKSGQSFYRNYQVLYAIYRMVLSLSDLTSISTSRH